MGELRTALAEALDGPDDESTYECAHCGADTDEWCDDCPECGGVPMRIVVDSRDDESSTSR